MSSQLGGDCQPPPCIEGKLQDDKVAAAGEFREKREAGISLLKNILLSGRAKKADWRPGADTSFFLFFLFVFQ